MKLNTVKPIMLSITLSSDLVKRLSKLGRSVFFLVEYENKAIHFQKNSVLKFIKRH